jgi:hypothetical protein
LTDWISTKLQVFEIEPEILATFWLKVESNVELRVTPEAAVHPVKPLSPEASVTRFVAAMPG